MTVHTESKAMGFVRKWGLTPFFAAALLYWASAATAATAAGQAALPVCTLAQDNPDKLAVEPCRPAPTRVKRRAVAQVIGRMPVQQQAPVAAARPMYPPPVVPVAPSGVTGPLPVMGCDAGGCRDPSGIRHDAGPDANGKLCHRDGPWLQCF